MPNYQISDESKRDNPMLGLIGFIVLIVLGGLSFAVSGAAVRFLSTANVVLGTARVLPIKFPPTWSPLGHQAVVAFGIFMILFVIAMIIMFTFMKPPGTSELDVSLDQMR